MSDLFAAVEVTNEVEGKRSIPGAAMLKALATNMATTIMAKIPEATPEFIEQVKDSQTSVTALDDLVKQECGAELNNPDVATFSEEDAKKLLKSNQSNRSRRKNMAMTQSNYMELLTSAIAEWILRESCGITKNAGGFGHGRKGVEITDEYVAELANDQDALGKAIRNVQSKKSTYKAKHATEPNWEESAEWQQLLEQEAALKSVRTTTTTHGSRKGMSVKKALQFIFDGVANTEELGKDDCMEIINACRNLANGVYPQDYLDMVAAKAADETIEVEEPVAVLDETEDIMM